MRVAILSHQAPAGDAIGNSIADKVAFFRDRSAQIRVFVERTRSIHPLIRPLTLGIAQTSEVREALAFMNDADLLLVEYGQYYPALNLLPLLAGRRPRVILDYHSVTPPELWPNHNREALMLGWQRRGIAWCADRVIAHSKFAAEELWAACRYPRERTFIIPHHAGSGVAGAGNARAKPAVSVRAELGLDGCRTILFVGRLAPNKRLGVLISALGLLGNRNPPLHLLVVGSTQDVYRQELDRCLDLARSLGVSDRVHFLGHLDDQRLRGCYETADLFVMPSLHEGFCIPILEAMAMNVPVVAAHAGALPETVGNAGLLFTPDDAAELAERVQSVLKLTDTPQSEGATIAPHHSANVEMRRAPRVAVVCFRFGPSIVGGAEKSLATMAAALQAAGTSVEVFSTCTLRESGWENDLTAGSEREGGLTVHRFPIDPTDRARHNDIVRRVLEQDGCVDAEGEQEFVRQSIHSGTLLVELRRRIEDFDAVITGPYLAGLTYDVCQEFPEKTLLVPCFHDEATVRLKIWQKLYRKVGGLLYHSAPEKSFAERSLGLNHPRSTVLGTWLDLERQGEPERGKKLANSTSYVLYCGRFSPQKNVSILLEWFREFHERNPGRISLVMVGQGPMAIPKESWCRNLGFVDDQTKADLLAGAQALVHLSVNESLSLVALEAWANGTPVLAHKDCAVLADLIRATGGGSVAGDAAAFEASALDIIDRREHWQAAGQRARAFVAEQYGSKARFTERLLDAVFSLSIPYAEIMKQRGKARAKAHSLPNWRDSFGRAIEETLDAPAVPYREAWEVVPHRPRAAAHAGQETAFIPIRLRNVGSHAALPDGPGARVLVAHTADTSGPEREPARLETLLPALIAPGEEFAAVARVRVPDLSGVYRIEIRCSEAARPDAIGPPDAVVELVVAERDAPVSGSCGPLLQAAGAALAEADRRQILPDDYADVTEGRLAGLKRRIKQKLLGNFKNAYVDVLSRKQTAFNRAVLEAVQEALECCELLDHAVSNCQSRDRQHWQKEANLEVDRALAEGRSEELSKLLKDLLHELAVSRVRQDALEKRLAALEAASRPAESFSNLRSSSE